VAIRIAEGGSRENKAQRSKNTLAAEGGGEFICRSFNRSFLCFNRIAPKKSSEEGALIQRGGGSSGQDKSETHL